MTITAINKSCASYFESYCGLKQIKNPKNLADRIEGIVRALSAITVVIPLLVGAVYIFTTPFADRDITDVTANPKGTAAKTRKFTKSLGSLSASDDDSSKSRSSRKCDSAPGKLEENKDDDSGSYDIPERATVDGKTLSASSDSVRNDDEDASASGSIENPPTLPPLTTSQPLPIEEFIERCKAFNAGDQKDAMALVTLFTAQKLFGSTNSFRIELAKQNLEVQKALKTLVELKHGYALFGPSTWSQIVANWPLPAE